MSGELAKSGGLVEGWRERAARAVGWQSGEDPEPVLDALALSVALELTGDLARVPIAERDALRKVGQRALLHVGGRDLDEDELEAMRMCASIARDGLRALSGRPLPPVSSRPLSSGQAESPEGPDVRVAIPPSDLTRLLRGQLDGFAAGSLAMRVRRSDAAIAELRMLLALAPAGSERPAGSAEGSTTELEAEGRRPLALAAADAAAVLDPAAGRALGTLEGVGAEAILFAGTPRRLAVYAEDPAPLRLVAPELTTEDVREGYWIGRIAEGATRIEAVLHVGDRSEPWVLVLD